MSMDGAPPTGSSGPPMAEVKTGPDGEIIGEPRNMQQMAAQRRLQQTQAQVDEVVGLMQVNVQKVLERDQLLSELDHRAEKLEDGASQFEKQAKSLKNKFWLENLKMMIASGVVGLIIIGILWYKYGSSDTTTVVVLPTQASVQQPTAIPTVQTTLTSVLINPTVATTPPPSSTTVVTSTITAVTTKLPTSTSTTVTTTTTTQSSDKNSPADPMSKSTAGAQKTS